MCGRFVLKSPLTIIEEYFRIDLVISEPQPSYNVAPQQNVAAVIHHEGSNQLVRLTWGLIPSWAKDPSIGTRLINARAESVTTKASFRSAFKRRRCLVLADGFYEWRKEGKVKTPVYIHLRSGKPFGFAGLYENWRSPEEEWIQTCTIVTTDSNELVRPIHGRMPVIVPKAQEGLWLDPANRDERLLLCVLKPYPAEDMACYEVSRMVNSPRYNAPECIEPLSSP